jgi:hypothetical protein
VERAQFEASFGREEHDLTPQAREQAHAEATEALRSGNKNAEYSPLAIARRTQGLTGELAREKAMTDYRKVVLNAHGYDRAMSALKEEFPYFVRRTDYQPLEQWQQDRGLTEEKTRQLKRRTVGGTDVGYVNTKTHLAIGRTKHPRTKGERAESAAAERTEATQEPGEQAVARPGTPKVDVNRWGDMSHLSLEQRQEVRDQLKAVPAIDPIVLPLGPGEQADVVKQDLSGLRRVDELVVWADHHGSMEAVADAYVKLTPEQQDQFLDRMLNPAGIKAAALNPIPEQHEEIAQAVHSMAQALDTLAPFGARATDESMLDVPGRRPLSFPTLTELGPSEHALSLWLNRSPSVAEVLEDVGDTPAEMQHAVNRAVREYQSVASDEHAPDSEVRKAAKHAASMQAAWAYKTALGVAVRAPKGRAPAPGQQELVSQRLGDPRERLRLALADVLAAG